MTDLLLKLLVILVIGFILYLSFTTRKIKENFSFTTPTIPDSSLSTSSNETNGVAANASVYNSLIDSELVKLEDALLVPKYTKEYKNILNSLAQHISLSSFNLLLNINTKDLANNDITHNLEKYNTYCNALTNLSNMRKIYQI